MKAPEARRARVAPARAPPPMAGCVVELMHEMMMMIACGREPFSGKRCRPRPCRARARHGVVQGVTLTSMRVTMFFVMLLCDIFLRERF